ncbi:chitin-binding protein [Pseudonocardiaceae bacterium YIM PH 21723]|nr:chitin-binding protein [Pseudonocardiaceae bacterium YIM PH 21723]
MTIRRKLTTLAMAVGLTPALLVVLPAGSAQAHGLVSSPASRQAQCMDKAMNCPGDAYNDPYGVEGAKGQQLCSAGDLQRYSVLDNDNFGWKATKVKAGPTAITWKIIASHETDNWEYSIDGKMVASIKETAQYPPKEFTHTIDLKGFSGKKKLLAVWNRATFHKNAFYSCIDLDIS